MAVKLDVSLDEAAATERYRPRPWIWTGLAIFSLLGGFLGHSLGGFLGQFAMASEASPSDLYARVSDSVTTFLSDPDVVRAAGIYLGFPAQVFAAGMALWGLTRGARKLAAKVREWVAGMTPETGHRIWGWTFSVLILSSLTTAFGSFVYGVCRGGGHEREDAALVLAALQRFFMSPQFGVVAGGVVVTLYLNRYFPYKKPAGPILDAVPVDDEPCEHETIFARPCKHKLIFARHEEQTQPQTQPQQQSSNETVDRDAKEASAQEVDRIVLAALNERLTGLEDEIRNVRRNMVVTGTEATSRWTKLFNNLSSTVAGAVMEVERLKGVHAEADKRQSELLDNHTASLGHLGKDVRHIGKVTADLNVALGDTEAAMKRLEERTAKLDKLYVEIAVAFDKSLADLNERVAKLADLGPNDITPWWTAPVPAPGLEGFKAAIAKASKTDE